MESLGIWCLTFAIMFTQGYCASQSMSCSTVNGQTICEKQQSDGNVAGSFAQSGYGNGQGYQDVGAMTGNTRTGDQGSSRTQTGNVPPGGFNFGGFNFGNGGGGSSSFSSSSSSSNGQPGGFAAGGAYAGPIAGPFDPFAFAGVPNPMNMFGGMFGRRR